MRTIPLLLLALLAACGDNLEPSSPDGATDFVTAPHSPWPQQLPHGGTVLPNVELITITFSDDPNRAQVEAFGDQIVTSSWYGEVGADYGVGLGSHAAKVSLGPAPTSIDGAGIETLVQQKIGDSTLPAPDPVGHQYLYMIYIPASVTLGADLDGEYGHHQESSAGGVKFALAVILDDGSGIDTVTSTAAHELIEAASDPYDAPDDGYYVDPPLPDPWWLLLGEVADLCDGERLIRSGDFAVQRSWSNTAAAAGLSPCVPFDPDDSTQDVTVEPATMPTIPAGGSATFTLTGWSTAPTADWQLDTYTADYSDLLDTEMSPTLSDTTINNGTSVTLTLHAPANAASGTIGGVYVLSYFDPAVPYAYRPWPVGFIVE